MKSYLGLTKVFLPKACLEKAYEAMRKSGNQGLEGVAVFAGIVEGTEFLIKETIIPLHSSYNVEQGLFYAIGSDELYRLNVMLHSKSLKLIAQIHSHPNEAYHSEADDRYALITKVGGLSIVVPDFATGRVDISNCGVFRLSESNLWLELSKNEVDKLISVD